MREPVPTSTVVAVAHERLRRAASAAGVALVPLDREPTFGPLYRALARVEALLPRPGHDAELAALDWALRDEHGPALAALLGRLRARASTRPPSRIWCDCWPGPTPPRRSRPRCCCRRSTSSCR